MAMEAQHLIDISLAKITQARFSRGGVSLHKNLLVATVLQKAKFMFMEEISHMVHHYYPRRKKGENCENDDDIDIMEGNDRDNENKELQSRGRNLFEFTRAGRSSPMNGASGSIILHNTKHMNDDEIDDDDDDDDFDSDSNDYVFLDDTDDIKLEDKKSDKYQINNQKWRRSSLKRRKEIDNSSSSSDENDVTVKRNKSDSYSTTFSHPTSVITEHKSDNTRAHPHHSSSSYDEVIIENAQFFNDKKNETTLPSYIDLSKQQINLHHNIDEQRSSSSSSSSEDDDDDDENQGQPDKLTAINGGPSLRSVDIERFTSLVSLFNITPQNALSSSQPPNQSPSTSNELCSSQATITTERENTIAAHPFLAMTV